MAMAQDQAKATQASCNSDGVCMVCEATPPQEEKLACKICQSGWHVSCLSTPPARLADIAHWVCPDCSQSQLASAPLPAANAKALLGDGSANLIAKVRAIQADPSLTEEEKAKKRQQLMSGKAAVSEDDNINDAKKKGKNMFDILSGTLSCAFCIHLPERPVTTPCGHTFCLKCFQKWIGQGKRTCAKCRSTIPAKMANQPRINSALVFAIRMARVSKNIAAGGGPSRVHHFVHSQDKPDKAYTTERSKRKGVANAASGKIFVTVPSDHFGPIPAENDPVRNQGLLVGESWQYRLQCRQWGAHFPPVSGIAGQSNRGAQSVVLAGGYVDDEDHGDWFLYTGSGGKDLSGNKRTNTRHSHDQKFESYNRALQVSCLHGYPVRVLRSHKETRSSYAPLNGLRYDGIYRIEKCWQKVGLQGFKVCRYLFVRCDNEPAPWTSDDHGDRPRPLPAIRELKNATALTEREGSPAWDFDEEDSSWNWKIPPPPTQKVKSGDLREIEMPKGEVKKSPNMSILQRLRRGFSCFICRKIMVSPVTTPCAHHFCKSCLQGAFAGQAPVRDRSRGGRTLRSQKNVMKCPACPIDISNYLQDLQVDIELMDTIEVLKAEAEENGESLDSSDETCAEDTDTGSENKNPAEESPEQCDAGEVEVAIKVLDPAVKRNAKRKKQLPEIGDAKRCRKVEEEAVA